MKSGRDAYREEIVALADCNGKILCLEADLGGHDHLFRRRYPDRFLNVGIAEHSLIGIASGFSENGFIPFVSTFAPFAAVRSAEVIKLSMSYMHLNIKLVCPYGGVSGAWFGPTHQSLEDIGIIQSMPGIYISAPHGERETRDVIRWAADIDGPVYIRLGRDGIFNDIDYIDALRYPHPRRVSGWNIRLQSLLIVSVGEIGPELVMRLQSYSEDVARIPHLHLPFLNREALECASDIIHQFDNVIVVEECRAITGVGSALALLNPSAHVVSFSPNDAWPSVGGTHEEILTMMGFSDSGLKMIVSKMLNSIGGKLWETNHSLFS